jgi:hypothetical protein
VTASLFLQSWTHDLELASCLLPAATGSWVSKRLVQFFPFPLGFILILFYSCYRRDDGGIKKLAFLYLFCVACCLAVGVGLLISGEKYCAQLMAIAISSEERRMNRLDALRGQLSESINSYVEETETHG